MAEGNIGNLHKTLNSILPPNMRPGNVGDYSSVTWPMWYQADFDFGTNPSYTSNSRQTQNFQNTQEAAFLFMAISRNTTDMIPLPLLLLCKLKFVIVKAHANSMIIRFQFR